MTETNDKKYKPKNYANFLEDLSEGNEKENGFSCQGPNIGLIHKVWGRTGSRKLYNFLGWKKDKEKE